MKRRSLLGLGGSDHEFSASLLDDRGRLVAIEEERLTRKKHGISYWFENPVERSVSYCLDALRVDLDDVIILSSDSIPHRVKHLYRHVEWHTYRHHLCHAASACLLLPSDQQATIIVIDGMGSLLDKDPSGDQGTRETISFYRRTVDGIELLGQTVGWGYLESEDFPRGATNSIGMLYEVVTTLLGFDIWETGKTMGLAAYGIPRFLSALRELCTLGPSINDCFRCDLNSTLVISALRSIAEQVTSFAARADLAASIQRLYEDVLIHCIDLVGIQDHEVLCIAGGCGLNAVANGRVAQHLETPVLIPPFTSDAGLGLGALHLFLSENHQASSLNGDPGIRSGRLGREYLDAEFQTAIITHYPEVYVDTSITGPSDLATLLTGGNIIGMFRGRSEIGPRALGGRSILADPRSVSSRERINRLIKYREPFRPLAPMILAERFNDYFPATECADSYMTKTAPAGELCRRTAPAIVHFDGTARTQVVRPTDDPFLRELLVEFDRLTGVPILLNTSFNRRGEPLVETPLDAIDAFLGSSLDGLLLGSNYVRRS